MKYIKHLRFILGAALMCMIATACEEDKDVVYTYINVPLSDHNPALLEGDVCHISIGTDGDNYQVASEDEEIVSACVKGNEIILTAGRTGKALVRLYDDGYNRAMMTVTVDKLQELVLESLPDGATALRLDNNGANPKVIKILSGNGDYTVTNNAPKAFDAVVEETEKGSGEYRIVLTGKSNTETGVFTVTDSHGKSASMNVRVTDPLQPLVLGIDDDIEGEYIYGEGTTPQQISFDITSGNGGYVVTSTNEGVATAELSDNTVTITITGDGSTTITITDKENEHHSVNLRVPMNTDDPTPRICWDGYRADLSSNGASVESTYATLKHIYWYQAYGERKDTYYVSFNGGWVNLLDCVGAANRNPKLYVTVNGTTTNYDDKATSPHRLTEFKLVKRIGTGPTSHPHIYFITFATDDGKTGFIVHRWNE